MNTKTIKLCHRFMCRPNLFLSWLLAAASLLSVEVARATDGTWTKTATGGLWSDTANWSGAVVADGSGAVANLGTLNLTAANTVLFDAPHTLGGLIFCDTTNAYFNWTLSNNGNVANVLTLDGAAPFITVSNTICTNNVVIAGTSGLTVQGGSTVVSGLVLGATNTFNGNVFIKTGTAANINNGLYLNTGGALAGLSPDSSIYLICTAANRAILYFNAVGIYSYANNLIMRPLGANAGSRAEFRVGLANVTNIWNGNIFMDGISGSPLALGDFYCDGTASMIVINGNISSTNNFYGSMNLRGASTGIVNGLINLPNVSFAKNDSGTWTINAANNVWSNTAVATGTLKFGVNNAIPITTTPIVIGGGSGTAYLDLNGYSQILSNSVVKSSVNQDKITNSTTTLSVLTFSNTVNAYCGVNIGGNISLVKFGVGTLFLTNANTYTGNTIISAGTLALTNVASLAGSANISVASGARFSVTPLTATMALKASQKLTGNGGTLVGSLNLSAGSLALNYTAGTPALTVTNGTLAFSGNAVTVTVSGSPLAVGSYKLVAKDVGGAVSGTVPTSVTVDGAGALASPSLQIVGGELYLLVQNVTSTDLASSANPSSFQDNVTFTATVLSGGLTATDATGTMAFSTNGVALTASGVVSGTASVSLANLPRGTNLITAIYSGDTSYLPSTNVLSQVVNNHVPVAGNLVIARNAGVSAVRVAISDVLAHVTDADSDIITLIGTGTSTNGVVVTQSGATYLYYNNPNNVDDAFTYTVTDGFGGTNSGTISFVVNTAVGQTTGQITSFAGGVANLTFHGIPNYTYITERSTDLVNWVDVSTNTAAANGTITMSDAFSDLGGVAPAAAYYRLKWQQ